MNDTEGLVHLCAALVPPMGGTSHQQEACSCCYLVQLAANNLNVIDRFFLNGPSLFKHCLCALTKMDY